MLCINDCKVLYHMEVYYLCENVEEGEDLYCFNRRNRRSLVDLL